MEHLYEEINDFKGVNANGEYRVNICLDNLKLSPYTREVILSNKCDVLLEMRSIYSSENVEIYYLTDDFENVDELMRHNNDFDVLACISDMLHALKRCEDYLIYPEELLLSPESIYYDENTREIKLMYLPNPENRMGVREAIIAIIDKKIAHVHMSGEDMDSFVEYKKDIFYREHYGISDLIRLTEEASRSRCSADIIITDMVFESDNAEIETVKSPVIKLTEHRKIIDIGARIKTMLGELIS